MPCGQTVPHLNELHEKYGKQGLTIIGVSDEPAAKVKPYIETKGIKYIIALGGANEYKTTDGIPHAWLVSAKGEVVWAGHPGNLQVSLLEEHLKDVQLAPQFKLPKDLQSAEKQLNGGNYAAGIKTLETHLKKPKNAETEKAAKNALGQINSFGKEKLKQAEEYAKERDYGEASEILESLEKSYKDTEIGTKAKDTVAEWKKDKDIKLELDGAALVQKAEAAIREKKYPAAAGFLLQVTKPKKFESTKVREIAQKKLKSIESKLKA